MLEDVPIAILSLQIYYQEWDETYNLENAAGLETSCAMINSNSVSWKWRKITQYSKHLMHFLNTDQLPNGLLGYSSTTQGDPWTTQWQDLKTIMATTWKEDMDVAMPLVGHLAYFPILKLP